MATRVQNGGVKRARLIPGSDLPELSGVIPPWPGEAVTVDDAVTYVRRTPATAPGAEPALYVHGLGGSAMNWTDLAFLLAGPAGDKVLPYTTEMGITLLWIAAALTMYTGYDYFKAGLKHIVDE